MRLEIPGPERIAASQVPRPGRGDFGYRLGRAGAAADGTIIPETADTMRDEPSSGRRKAMDVRSGSSSRSGKTRAGSGPSTPSRASGRRCSNCGKPTTNTGWWSAAAIVRQPGSAATNRTAIPWPC